MSVLHSKSNDCLKKITFQFNAVKSALKSNAYNNHLHLAPFCQFLILCVEIAYFSIFFFFYLLKCTNNIDDKST